jgi:hypothetical protein
VPPIAAQPANRAYKFDASSDSYTTLGEACSALETKSGSSELLVGVVVCRIITPMASSAFKKKRHRTKTHTLGFVNVLVVRNGD